MKTTKTYCEFCNDAASQGMKKRIAELDAEVSSLKKIITAAGKREALVRSALERYIAKFGNCGAVYVQALEAMQESEGEG
jgi:hypothetical protein